MGIQDEAFRQMCLNAMKIWSKFGNNSISCKILLSQLRKYSENGPPYDMDYIDEDDFLDTPELWWTTCRQPNNYIQQLALKLFDGVIVTRTVLCYNKWISTNYSFYRFIHFIL